MATLDNDMDNVLERSKLEAAQHAYHQRFKYYGDLWLTQHDVFSKMTIEEVFQLGFTSQVYLISPFEMAYLNGQKLDMTSQIAFISGINRVLKTDPKKYRAVLEKNKTIRVVNFEDLATKNKQSPYG